MYHRRNASSRTKPSERKIAYTKPSPRKSSLNAIGHAGDKNVMQFDKDFRLIESGDFLRVQQEVFGALHIHKYQRAWLAPEFCGQVLRLAPGCVRLNTIHNAVDMEILVHQIDASRIHLVGHNMRVGAPLGEAPDVVAMRRPNHDDCGGRMPDDVLDDRMQALLVGAQHFPIPACPAAARAAKAGKRSGEDRAVQIQYRGGYWVVA